MTNSPDIFVGFNEAIGDVIVTIDGKLVGSAKGLLQFVGAAYLECERQRAVPTPGWLEDLRKL